MNFDTVTIKQMPNKRNAPNTQTVVVAPMMISFTASPP